MSCRDGGDGEIVRGFSMPYFGKHLFNIDPPTSPYAIMRRAKPLPRREQWNRLAHQGELDPDPRVREQPQPYADITTLSKYR